MDFVEDLICLKKCTVPDAVLNECFFKILMFPLQYGNVKIVDM